MAAFTPMPRPRVSTTATARPGERRTPLSAWRRPVKPASQNSPRFPITTLLRSVATIFLRWRATSPKRRSASPPCLGKAHSLVHQAIRLLLEVMLDLPVDGLPHAGLPQPKTEQAANRTHDGYASDSRGEIFATAST